MKGRIFLIIYIFWSISVAGQINTIATDSLISDEPALRLISYFDGDKVVLRWAPDSYMLWKNGNIEGYTIIKTILDDNYNEIAKTKFLIRHLTREEYVESKNREEFYMLAAANLLFSNDSIETSPFSKYQFQKRNLSMVLLCADMSADAAGLLGLRYEDGFLEKGKNYVYKVIPNYQDTLHKFIYSNSILIDTRKIDTLHGIQDVSLVQNDGAIRISWPRLQNNGIRFTAYNIERSEDGRNYKKINDLPYTQPKSSKEALNSIQISYIDSVQNYKTYYYRIQGITPFGINTPYSEAVFGYGIDLTPPSQPKISKLEWESNNTVKLEWETENTRDIVGYYISRLEMSGQKSETLTPTILPPNSNSYIDMKPSELYMYSYYITAVDTAGNFSTSLPEVVMKADIIPPSVPLRLTGQCDSTGLVTLIWNSSPEEDTRGYYIYVSNHPNHEYARVNPFPHWDTTYTYQTTLKTLDHEIYFKITSIDFKHNVSEFSQYARVVRPDTIPPNPPVFNDYKLDTSSVILYWNKSFHKDVKEQIIYRKSLNGEYGVIATLAANIEKYTDTKITQGTMYEYKIAAIDDSDLKSGFASRLELKVPDTSEKGISPLDLKITRMDDKINLEWSDTNADKIKIYRKVDNGPLLSYVIIDGNKTGYSDLKIKKGTKYSYSTQVIKGKETSPISKLYSVSK